MTIRFLIVALVLLLGTNASLQAGGWPQPKGFGYFKLSQWWVIADQHYSDAGLIDPNVTQALWNTSLYGEYGLTDRLTGVLYAPVFSRAYFNNLVSGTTGEVLLPGEAINGIGDVDLGLRYGLWKNDSYSLSGTLTLGLPLGNPSGGSQGNLQTGDGEFNQLLQLDLGRGFKVGKLPAYANVYAGFNNRTKGFSDEFRYGIEAGVNLFNEKLYVILRAYGIESFQNGSLQAQENSSSLFANNSEHLTIAPEISYQLNDRWGLSATYAYAVRGRIIFAAPAYSVGVFFKLKR